MRKDIEIPESTHLKLLAVREFHEDLGCKVWNIYLYNQSDDVLETILIVARGEQEDRRTSMIRRSVSELLPGGVARLELLTDELVPFRNEFLITYFGSGGMFEKKFELPAMVLQEEEIRPIPETGLEGLIFE